MKLDKLHSIGVVTFQLNENKKQAKQYLDKGDIDKETFDELLKIDPSPTKKYVGWMAKQIVSAKLTPSDLKSYIEEYHVLHSKNKVKTKDINQFKSFGDLKKEVDKINQSGDNLSLKDLEEDYEVIVDNDDLYIAVPHTHEASRKLGLSKFNFRECADGKKDSAWCTTYATSSHFDDYYYTHGVTFYYVLIRSEKIMEELSQIKELQDTHKKDKKIKAWQALRVSAICILPKGQIDFYDGLDEQIKKNVYEQYFEIVGLEP